MSRWLSLVVGVSLLLMDASIGLAQSSFPTVYGSTGTPYGPTQAEYQYRRQYGRPWHGYGGQVSSGSVGGNYVVPGSFGYPSYYGCHHAAPWGQPVYVNLPFSFGYTAPGPYIYGMERLTNPSPFIPTAVPLGGSLQRPPAIPLTGPDLADGLGPIQPLAGQIDPSQRPVARASAAARLKSLEKQAFGDEQLRKQQWAKAYVEYRAAVDAAPDQADAHYHLGFLFVAMQHHASAVREFKRAVFLDPTLPQTGEKMAELFGPDSQILRTSILHKVADWLREDIRDPDRLFLFGLLLHSENNARGREVLEAAERMANSSGRFTDHIVAFLSLPVEPPVADGPKPDPGLIDLPNLIPQPAAPGGVGPAPANNGNLPPAPLPQAPAPDERLPALPRLSNEATPP